jgi:hypothetical protein
VSHLYRFPISRVWVCDLRDGLRDTPRNYFDPVPPFSSGHDRLAKRMRSQAIPLSRLRPHVRSIEITVYAPSLIHYRHPLSPFPSANERLAKVMSLRCVQHHAATPTRYEPVPLIAHLPLGVAQWAVPFHELLRQFFSSLAFDALLLLRRETRVFVDEHS